MRHDAECGKRRGDGSGRLTAMFAAWQNGVNQAARLATRTRSMMQRAFRSFVPGAMQWPSDRMLLPEGRRLRNRRSTLAAVGTACLATLLTEAAMK